MAPEAPYRFESAAWRRGVSRLAGVDEAGRGPLAGPVVAAAVVLAPGERIRGVDDSKRLDPLERARLYEIIHARALGVGVAVVDHLTIDRINILQASRLAMAQALGALGLEPELVLTDFVEVPGLRCPQRNLVEGDRRSASVAAASIVAKVTRDRQMLELHARDPRYGFDRHKGYATADHLDAVARFGYSAIHRRSFRPTL